MRSIILTSILISAFAFGQDVYLRLTDYGGGKINLVAERFTARGPTSARGELSRQINIIEDILKKDLEYSLYFDIFEDDGELVGQQYMSDTGPIDILAVSKDKKTLLAAILNMALKTT